MAEKAWLDAKGQWSYVMHDQAKVVDETCAPVPCPRMLADVDKILQLCKNPEVLKLKAFRPLTGVLYI